MWHLPIWPVRKIESNLVDSEEDKYTHLNNPLQNKYSKFTVWC